MQTVFKYKPTFNYLQRIINDLLRTYALCLSVYRLNSKCIKYIVKTQLWKIIEFNLMLRLELYKRMARYINSPPFIDFETKYYLRFRLVSFNI